MSRMPYEVDLGCIQLARLVWQWIGGDDKSSLDA